MNPTDPNPYIPRIPLKYILIAAGILIVIIIVCLLFFYKANNKFVVKKNVYTENNFLPGIQSVYPSKTDPNVVTIFNGRNFIQYNPTNKQSSRILSNDLNLPNLSNIKWSKDGKSISFNAKDYRLDDDLGKILKASNKSLSVSHYWTFDIENRKAKLIQNSNTDADAVFWSRQTNNIFYFTTQEVDEDGSSLNTIIYRADNKTSDTKKQFQTDKIIKNVIDISPSSLIALIGNSTNYFVTPITNGASQKPLATLTTDTFEISPDSNYFYYFDMSKSIDEVEEGATEMPGELVISKLSDGKKVQSIKDENLSYIYQWSKDSKSIYDYGSSDKNGNIQLKKYDITGNQVSTYISNKKNDIHQLNAIGMLPSSDGSVLYIIKADGIATVSLKQIDRPNNLDINNIKTPDNRTDYIVSYDDKYKKVILTILKDPQEKYIALAVNEMSQKGFDPNLIPYTLVYIPPGVDNYHGR